MGEEGENKISETNTDIRRSSEQEQNVEEKGEKEEIDIDLNDPDVEHAATKIQAGFKGMKARKEVNTMKAGGGIEAASKNVIIDKASDEVNKVIDKAKMEVDALKVEVEEVIVEKIENNVAPKKDEDVDIDLNDPDVEQAATKIQAGFKGMKARKEVPSFMKEESKTNKKDNGSGNAIEEDAPSEIIDIDLNDPEVEQAA